MGLKLFCFTQYYECESKVLLNKNAAALWHIRSCSYQTKRKNCIFTITQILKQTHSFAKNVLNEGVITAWRSIPVTVDERAPSWGTGLLNDNFTSVKCILGGHPLLTESGIRAGAASKAGDSESESLQSTRAKQSGATTDDQKEKRNRITCPPREGSGCSCDLGKQTDNLNNEMSYENKEHHNHAPTVKQLADL